MSKQVAGIVVGLLALVAIIGGVTYGVTKDNKRDALTEKLYNEQGDDDLSEDIGKDRLLTSEKEAGVQVTTKSDAKVQKDDNVSTQCGRINATTVYVIAEGDTLTQVTKVFQGYPVVETTYKGGKFHTEADYYDYDKKVVVRFNAVNGKVTGEQVYYYGNGEVTNITHNYPYALDLQY